MNKNTSIKLKASFLLLVFSLNTVIGFACAMGVNIDFNSISHHDAIEVITKNTVPVSYKKQQQHAEEGKHLHKNVEEAITTTEGHPGVHEHKHHSEETKNHHASKEDSEKGGCCTDEVIKFQSLEKNINQYNNPLVHPQLFVILVSYNWNINIFNCAKTLPHHYKARIFHPPAPDILIAIQRFLI